MNQKMESTPSDTFECSVCLEHIGITNCSTTKCGHKFCFQCIGRVIATNQNACPLCRQTLVEGIELDETSDFHDAETIVGDFDDMSDDEDDQNVDICEGNVGFITQQFMEQYTSTDIMTLLIDQFEPSDLSTIDQIWKFKKMRDFLGVLLTASSRERHENDEMGQEDTNVLKMHHVIECETNIRERSLLMDRLRNINLNDMTLEHMESIRQALNAVDDGSILRRLSVSKT